MTTHVVLNDDESTVIQLSLEVLKRVSPSVVLTEHDNVFLADAAVAIIDGVLEKIDEATKLQHPIIEM